MKSTCSDANPEGREERRSYGGDVVKFCAGNARRRRSTARTALASVFAAALSLAAAGRVKGSVVPEATAASAGAAALGPPAGPSSMDVDLDVDAAGPDGSKRRGEAYVTSERNANRHQTIRRRRKLSDVGAIDDYSYYDRIRRHPDVVRAIRSAGQAGVVRVALPADDPEFGHHPVGDGDGDGKNGEMGHDDYWLRHFTSINPFILGGTGSPRQSTIDAAGAALLALHHFNRGISDVVPQIAHVSSICPIRFTLDFIDTQLSPIRASRFFIEDILHRGKIDHLKHHDDFNPDEPYPTALIGASRSAVSAPLAILSGVHDMPQISYASTSTVLDNKDQYPLFGRLVPSAVGDANAAVEYMILLGATHIGVLFVRDAYGSTYAQAVQERAARSSDMHVDLASFAFDPTSAEISSAIGQLKESGVRYFIGVIFDKQYREMMSEAHRQGIAGEGYFWMFGDAITSVRGYEFDPATEAGLIEATHGAAVVTTAFPSTREGRPEFEAFMDHWKELRKEDGELRKYFDSKMPFLQKPEEEEKEEEDDGEEEEAGKGRRRRRAMAGDIFQHAAHAAGATSSEVANDRTSDTSPTAEEKAASLADGEDGSEQANDEEEKDKNGKSEGEEPSGGAQGHEEHEPDKGEDNNNDGDDKDEEEEDGQEEIAPSPGGGGGGGGGGGNNPGVPAAGVFSFSETPGPFALIQYDVVVALAFAACDASYGTLLSTSTNGGGDGATTGSVGGGGGGGGGNRGGRRALDGDGDGEYEDGKHRRRPSAAELHESGGGGGGNKRALHGGEEDDDRSSQGPRRSTTDRQSPPLPDPKLFTGRELYDSFLRTDFEGLFGRVRIDPRTGSRDYTTVPYSISNFVAPREYRTPEDWDEGKKVTFDLITTDLYDGANSNGEGDSGDKEDGKDEEAAAGSGGGGNGNGKGSNGGGGGESVWKNIKKFTFSGLNYDAYEGGRAPQPLVLPPGNPTIDIISQEARIFGWVLCCISILLSLGYATWTFLNRNNEIVRASQPIFLGMLCLGALLIGSTIIPMSLQEPVTQDGLDAACIATPWLFSFGFIVAFSALFSKTMRVNQIFRSRSGHSRVAVKARDVMKPFIFLFIANLAVLISWTIVSPLTYFYTPKGPLDNFDRPRHYYATCHPVDAGWDDLFFVLLWGAINISALLYANFQAYQGRCILTEYSESQYIGISMAILLQSFVIGVPVMVVVDDSPTARFVLRTCLVFVTVVAVLLPIFLPKMIFLRQWRAHEKRMERKMLLNLKKQRQMDALAVGDGSLTSWYARQMGGSSKFSGYSRSSREAHQPNEQNVGIKIIAKHEGDTRSGNAADDSSHPRRFYDRFHSSHSSAKRLFDAS